MRKCRGEEEEEEEANSRGEGKVDTLSPASKDAREEEYVG